jgi:hypothetical protein
MLVQHGQQEEMLEIGHVYHYHQADNINLQLMLLVKYSHQVILVLIGQQETVVGRGSQYHYQQPDNINLHLLWVVEYIDQ